VKIAIVGTGAIGCLFGAVLAKSGRQVCLVGRARDEVEAIKKRGVLVERDGGSESVKVPAFLGPSEAGEADLVIVAVKAYDTAAAAQTVASLLSKGGAALTLQNGIGSAETLAEKIGEGRVLCGTTAQGSNVVAPGHIRHAGAGETLLGEMDGSLSRRAEEIAAALTGGGIPAKAVENAPGHVWLKLLINAAINPLTAIFRVRNGALLDLPGAAEIMQKAVAEAEAVARARRIKIPCDDVMKKVREVCRATGGNISSMLQDVRAGRRTEVEYINGAVARLGAEASVPTPHNDFLAAVVRAIEAARDLPPEKLTV
jgi:2-dehydropantoate 2-reductase